MPSTNHYQTLGLKRGCKDTEIRSQYRKLALKNHPDKNRGNPNATANFQKILDAAEILSDPTKRHAYDREHFGTDWNADIFDTDEYQAKQSKNSQAGCHPNNKFQPKPKSSRQREKERHQQKKRGGARRWAAFTTPDDKDKTSPTENTAQPESPPCEKDNKESSATEDVAEPEIPPRETAKYQEPNYEREFAQRKTNYQSACVVDPSLSGLFTGLEFNDEDDPCRADDLYWDEIADPMGRDFRLDPNMNVAGAMNQHVADAEEARERERKAHEEGTWESAFVTWGKMQGEFDRIVKERLARRLMNGEELERMQRRIGRGEEKEREEKSLIWRIGTGEEMERC